MERINTVGRRKSAIARVFMSEGKGNITINKRDYTAYFTVATHQHFVEQAFKLTETLGKFDIVANLDGGGITGQSQAVRLAIARALCKVNPEYRPILKSNGLLTRDPREVERKKPGQPKARKRFQFSKR